MIRFREIFGETVQGFVDECNRKNSSGIIELYQSMKSDKRQFGDIKRNLSYQAEQERISDAHKCGFLRGPILDGW